VNGGGGQRSVWHASKGGGSPVHRPRLEIMGQPGKKGNGPGPGRIVPSSIYLNIVIPRSEKRGNKASIRVTRMFKSHA
jgi:hypothetical protein